MIEKNQLVEIAGAANVIDNRATLNGYAADFSFVNPVQPAFIVRPQNLAEIKQLVNLAKESHTPLVPVSSGGPHFRGDSVPSAGGAIIVDLSHLKKIIRADRYHRVAMVETGVTFAELIPAAQKEGIRLNMPLLPRQSKSVVGSLLEREPVTMPKYQWDISDPLACLEVVFGTGDDFRTGQAAGPGSIEEQWAAGGVQKAPYGPGPIAWHRLVQGAQGTMGIVTWASMRCEILPTLQEPFLAGASELGKLFDLTYWLVRRRLANECFIVNRTNLAAILAKNWPADFVSVKSALPPWLVFFNLAGYDYFPDERVAYQKKDVQSICQNLGLEFHKTLAGVSANEILKTIQRASTEPYWKLRAKGSSQDIFFLSTYAKLGGLIETMNGLADRAGYPASDMGIYIQPTVQGTNCHCEFNLFYDPASATEKSRIKNLSTVAVRTLMDKGAFFSRPYGENAGLIMNRDAASVEALTRIKKILDPENILNPGKLCF